MKLDNGRWRNVEIGRVGKKDIICGGILFGWIFNKEYCLIGYFFRRLEKWEMSKVRGKGKGKVRESWGWDKR